MNDANGFSDLVMGVYRDNHAPFETQVVHDVDGDCIEFLSSDEDFWAERIDSLVTVYYGRESGEIIGSLIKGVRSIVQQTSVKLPGFRIEIEDGPVRLEHFFSAKMWSDASPDVANVRKYRKLREVADRANAKVDLCGCI